MKQSAPALLQRHLAAGFTVVELVLVVILLGILGVAAMSRFVEPSAFAPGIVSETLIAEARIAQQIAASRRDAAVTLTVDRLGADWRFRVATSVDGVVRTQQVAAENTGIQAASGAVSDDLDAATPLVLQFGHDGDLAAVVVGATPGSAALGVSLGISGDSARAACIYPTGYASASACR